MLGLERGAKSYRWPCWRRDLPLLFRTRLACAATRLARHPPHLSWPAWTARGLRSGTSREASVTPGASDVRFGQKQTYAVHNGMSALPLKADIKLLIRSPRRRGRAARATRIGRALSPS